MVGHKLGLCLLVREWRRFSWGLGPAWSDPVRLPPTASRRSAVAQHRTLGRWLDAPWSESLLSEARLPEARLSGARWFAVLLLGVLIGMSVAPRAAWARWKIWSQA